MNAREHLATLAAVLAIAGSEASHIVAHDAIELLRMGRSAATQVVRSCNGEGHWDSEKRRTVWDDTDSARYEKRTENIRSKAQSIADRYGAKVEIGGDPRGYVMRLHFADKKLRNIWGEGFGVA